MSFMRSKQIQGWKVFTHDLCSPIQGGEPVWDGTTPWTTPPVTLDESRSECAAGWNFCRAPELALRIGGLWPDGWPSRLFVVEAESCLERGEKCRAVQLTVIRETTSAELHDAIVALSQPFAPHVFTMVAEQEAWRAALARPHHDSGAVETHLRAALARRRLDWTLTQYPTVQATRDAWTAWATMATRDARDALCLYFASLRGWITHPQDMLTAGLRDAYANGLAVALPTGPRELGWVMEKVITWH